MGQFWKLMNLDKGEFIHPHKMGSGLKLGEILSHPGPGAALVVLCAAQREVRGNGDLKMNSDVARRTVGRWAGDRIVLVGDYTKDADLPSVPKFGDLYGRTLDEDPPLVDITDDVCAVLKDELQ